LRPVAFAAVAGHVLGIVERMDASKVVALR
jgi:hypothetical protein